MKTILQILSLTACTLLALDAIADGCPEFRSARFHRNVHEFEFRAAFELEEPPQLDELVTERPARERRCESFDERMASGAPFYWIPDSYQPSPMFRFPIQGWAAAETRDPARCLIALAHEIIVEATEVSEGILSPSVDFDPASLRLYRGNEFVFDFELDGEVFHAWFVLGDLSETRVVTPLSRQSVGYVYSCNVGEDGLRSGATAAIRNFNWDLVWSVLSSARSS